MVFATLSHGLVTLSSTYCFPWWFLPLCATRALPYLFIFELSGFTLSIVYSLVVFATLCHQGFVMLLYLFLNWWFSTFNCSFPGGFCHSVPPGLSFWSVFLIGGFPLFHYFVCSLAVFTTLSHQPGPIFINDTFWTAGISWAH